MGAKRVFNGDFTKGPWFNEGEAGHEGVLALDEGVRLHGWTFEARMPGSTDWPGRAIDVIKGEYAFAGEERKRIAGNAVELTGRAVPGCLQQALHTEAGETYDVTFWAGYPPRPDATAGHVALLAQAVDGHDDNLVLASRPVRIECTGERRADKSFAPGWRQYRYRFTARSHWSIIRFTDTTYDHQAADFSGAVIADVRVSYGLLIADREPQAARPGRTVRCSVELQLTGKRPYPTETVTIVAPQGTRFADGQVRVNKPGRAPYPFPGTISDDGGLLTAHDVLLGLHPHPDPDRTAVVATDITVEPEARPGDAHVRFHIDTGPSGTASLTIT